MSLFPNCQILYIGGAIAIIYESSETKIIDCKSITIHLVRENIEPPKNVEELYDLIKSMIFEKSEKSVYANESSKESFQELFLEVEDYYVNEAEKLRKRFKKESSVALRQIKDL